MGWLASTTGVRRPAPGQAAASLSASILSCTVFSFALSASPGTGCRGFRHGITRRRSGNERAGGWHRRPRSSAPRCQLPLVLVVPAGVPRLLAQRERELEER